MVDITTISVRKEIYDKLKECKIHKDESFSSLIERLMTFYKKEVDGGVDALKIKRGICESCGEHSNYLVPFCEKFICPTCDRQVFR